MKAKVVLPTRESQFIALGGNWYFRLVSCDTKSIQYIGSSTGLTDYFITVHFLKPQISQVRDCHSPL